MSDFKQYLKQFQLTDQVTDEEIEKTKLLLQIYAPTMRRAAHNIDEMEEACAVKRSQSVSDYINLAIDYEHDADRKRITDRLNAMGYSMQLLSMMEDALLLVKSDPTHGGMYFDILRTRYFDAYCKTHEDAFLTLGISPATYYRNLKKAIRVYAANLWCVVVPDMLIRQIECGDDDLKTLA